MSGSGFSEQPLACDRSALSPEQRSRHEQLWKRVDELSPGPATTSTGVAFRVPRQPGLAGEMGELAGLEQVCCPFMRVTLTLEPHGGPLVLELSGSGQLQDFPEQEVVPR